MIKILIAEDDAFLVAAYKAKFTKAGFELKIALDGNEVLEVLKTFTPDIILLDLIMPNKDGFSVLEAMKQDSALAKIPVLVASNLGQVEDTQRAMSLGAKGFIIKSDYSLEQIIEKVHSIIG